MERIDPPKGYVLKSKDDVRKIIEVEAELLRSEGIDPTWPGFGHLPDEQDDIEQQ